MASNSHPSAKSEMPLIPPLTLESCETGGGWGVGEIFARLPPAQEQEKSQEKLYRVVNSSSQTANSKSLSLKPTVLGSSMASGAIAKTSFNGVTQSTPGVVYERSSDARGADRSLTEAPYVRVNSTNRVPIVTYKHQEEDDDNTFIDHGSVSNGASTQKAASGGGNLVGAMWRPPQENTPPACPIPLWTNTMKPNTVQSRRVNSSAAVATSNSIGISGPHLLGVEKPSTGVNMNSGVSSSLPAATSSLALSPSVKATTHKEGGLPISSIYVDYQRIMSSYGSSDTATTAWRPPRIVSELLLDAPARDLAVSPNGGAIWAAFGDHPPTLFEVISEKSTLASVRSINWITQVYCMAVVPVPTAKRITFKSVTATEESGPSFILNSSMKRRNKCNTKSSHLLGSSSLSASDDNLCTYALWCGLSRGNISIVDLDSFTDAGIINGAHDQTVNKIWYLENGRVWTAGRDKALKVWDPQTRRLLKKRNIAAVLSDLCYVSTMHQVWAIADDAYIRVYEAGGNNVRIQKHPIDHAENALKMRSDVVLIDYHQDGNFVWASMSKNTVLIDPRTFAVCQTLLVSLIALVFHKKTAVICGRGPLLLDSDADSVAILDVTNPVEPSLLFSGFHVNSPSRLGIHLLTEAQPFAIIEYISPRSDKKTLCMFTYEEFNGRVYREEENIPPQRKIKGGRPSVPSQNVHSSSLANAGIGMNSSIAAVGTFGGAVSSSVAGNKQSSGRTSSPAGLSVSNNPIFNPNTRHGPPIQSFVRAFVPPSVPSPSFNNNLLVASAEVSFTLDQMDKKLEEVRKAVAIERREKGPLSDFSKLHNALTKWIVEVTDYAPTSLPPAVLEELSREYETPEGKALAIAFARLHYAVTGKKHPTDVAVGNQGSERYAVIPLPQPATPVSKTMTAHSTSTTVPPSRLDVSVSNVSASQTSSSDAPNCGSSSLLCPGRPELSIKSAESPVQMGGSYVDRDPNSAKQILLSLIKEERQTHQAQVQSLQQHNSRIHLRLETFITSVKDFLNRTKESYQEFKDIQMNGLPQETSMAYEHLLEILAQTPSFSVNSCSSREEIISTFQKQVGACERNIQALKNLLLALYRACTTANLNCGNSVSPLSFLDGSQRISLPQTQPSSCPRDLSEINAHPFSTDEVLTNNADLLSRKVTQSSMSRGSPVFKWAQNESGDRASELEWYLQIIACSDLSQNQLIRLIREEIANVEESMRQVEGKWNMLKQSRRQVMDDITQRCRRSGKDEECPNPVVDFSEDFMECMAVWDLSIAEVFIQMCKDEASLVIMEALLEWQRDTHPQSSTCQSSAYENPFQNWVHTISSPSYRRRSGAHGHLARAEGDSFTRLSGSPFGHGYQSCNKLAGDFVMDGVAMDDSSDVNHKRDWASDDDTYNASRGSESSAAWITASQQVSMLSLRMESVVAGIRASLKQEISLGENVLKSLSVQDTLLPLFASEPVKTSIMAQEGAKPDEPSAGNEKEANNTIFNKDLYLGLAGPKLCRFVKIHASRLDGFVHWAHVGVYLTVLCLNTIRALIYPTTSSILEKDGIAPFSPSSSLCTIDIGNFLVINNKLIDCAYFLTNIMTYAYVTRCVLLGWQSVPKSSTLSTNDPPHNESNQFSFGNVHRDPLGNVNGARTQQGSLPHKTLHSPIGESLLSNSMDCNSAVNNSKQSSDCQSNLKCTFGHPHSDSTSVEASEDVTVTRGWVRRDLHKWRWTSLFSFYTKLVLRQQIIPEFFSPTDNEECADDGIDVKQVDIEDNDITNSASRRSGRSKAAEQSQNGEEPQKIDKSRHIRRGDSESQQVTSRLSKYAEKVGVLFEIASNTLEYLHQLEKRMQVIGRENSDNMNDAGGSRDRGKSSNKGSATRVSNRVLVSYVNEAGCLRAMDPHTILHRM
ncbi:unnamed protein product [Phytomonas sp. Hart1]|nr:unnamed protein product [Phytomonas sp. Hart1]|eukprot:CCW66832.1 unnamed protein product [Phytomonas sp. isolate Hart1]